MRIYNGFFWHGYGMQANEDFQGMSYPPRAGDKRNARRYLTAYRQMHPDLIGTSFDVVKQAAPPLLLEVTLSPNPVKGEAMLKLYNDVSIQSMQIEIYDVFGRKVTSGFELIKTISSKECKIIPTTWVSGSYILTLTDNKGWKKNIAFAVSR